ncbi:MBL fold metallo-hydrolase [Sciscionella marina]|uniref:MBL fold metallo-hydrolase n=1 Tax=Sciscionella marina TaxID=508770 RepID=UPI0004777789|nr:MBL fold metallo-hydrolase [Sciscionella marina]
MSVELDDPARRWYEPGVFTVAPGVHRIPLPLPDELRAVNVYAVEGNDGFTLIDSGLVLDAARTQLEAALKDLGGGLGDVRQFLVTHVHRDHYTQAVAVRRDFGARVGLGVGEQPSLAVVSNPASTPYRHQLASLRRNGAEKVADELTAVLPEESVPHSAWEAPDEWLQPGTVVRAGHRGLEAKATPGHTQGHLVYFDRAACLLFGGDHILPHITPSIGLEPVPGESPLGDYLDSLRAVRLLPDARLLPAHGPVIDSSHARIDELLRHHDTRLQLTAEAVVQGAATAYEVSEALRWTGREREFATLPPRHQMMAVIETVWHLALLEVRGVVTSEERNGTIRFAPASTG